MPKKLLTAFILLFALTALAQDTIYTKARNIKIINRQYLQDSLKNVARQKDSVINRIVDYAYAVKIEYEIQPLIISSYHINDSLLNAPASVSILSRYDLQRNNNSDITPILNTLPGVFMQSGGINTNRISIRGIGARTPYGTNKIRAFYGSIPLTSGDSETTIEDIDLQMLNNVEIIKGPLSSVYGAGLGGAILLEPQHQTNEQSHAMASSTFGSFGLQKNTINYGYSGKGGSLNLSYHNLNTDGWRNNSAYRREGITLAGDVFRTDTGTLTYFGNYTYLKAFIPSSVNLDTYTNNPQAAAPTWAASKGFERYKSWMGGLAYDWKVTDFLSNSTSLFASSKQNYEPRPFDILTQDNMAWGARTQFKGSFDIGAKQVNFIAGAEYFNDGFTGGTYQNLHQDNNGNGSLEGERLTGSEQQRNFINVFAQARVHLAKKLEVQAGVNYNKTNFDLDNTYPLENTLSQQYSYKGIWSPQVSLIYQPGTLQTLYTTVSRGFSMPAIEETLTPQGTINPDIKPESGYNFEVGYKAYWLGKKLYTEISAYSMQVNNLLVAQRVGDDQYVGVNAGKTLHQGIEVTVKYVKELGKNWTIQPYAAASMGHYEFKEFLNSGVDYSGNDLTGVPKNKINAGISLAMPFSLYLTADYYYVDSMPLNDANSGYADSYNVLNVKLGWSQLLFKGQYGNGLLLNLSAGVNNITDTRYASMVLVNATGINGAAPRYYYPGLPVNYYGNVSIAYNF
ncbi:MAG: TonB-dependent receptor [Bacteroidota bacterium]